MVRLIAIVVMLWSAPMISVAAELNSDITLSRDVLTVGDVFTDAGIHQDHVLAPAPRAGNVLILSTQTLRRIADSFDIAWTPARGTETATIRLGAAHKSHADAAQKSVRLPVLSYAHSRDDIIAEAAIKWLDVPVRLMGADTVTRAEDLVGMSANGLLKPDMPVSKSDLRAPKMVKRGDLVSITLRNGRIELTSQARALHDARHGDILRVKNEQSERVVQVRVTGPREGLLETTSSGGNS